MKTTVLTHKDLNKSKEEINKIVKERTYTYHQDPAHGWVEIPLSELRLYNLDISKYSYQDRNSAYLEEDSDLSKLMRALQDRGITMKFNYIHVEGRHWIRELPSYVA